MNDRWYDNDERLRNYLEELRYIPSFKRLRLVQDIMWLMTEFEDDLIDRFVLDFPLEIKDGQWYDYDPYLWLVINGLQYGNPQLHHQIAAYLSKNLAKDGPLWFRFQ